MRLSCDFTFEQLQCIVGFDPINLTKTKGDGSLAHEVGHFLDNMLAHKHLGSESLSPYLSDSANEEGKSPVVKAMANVMSAIETNAFKKETVTSEVAKRGYQEKWVLESWNKSGQSPQKAIDLLVSQYEGQFTTGSKACEKSKWLVNSIAKWTGQPVEIEIRYLECTEYFSNEKAYTILVSTS